jgi:hypothetical protein
LLLRDLGHDEAQVVGEILKMMPDERSKQDAEMKQKVELMRLAQSQQVNQDLEKLPLEALRWLSRPTMTDYCGLKEQQEVALIHELKNINGRCGHDGSYAPHDKKQRSCATCRHCRMGGGKARDAAHFERLKQLTLNATAMDQGSAMHQWDEFRQFVASAKSLEAAAAYYSARIVNQAPEYLPYCSLNPSDAEFIPCAVRNPHDECSDWAPKEPEPALAEEALKLIMARVNPEHNQKKG